MTGNEIAEVLMNSNELMHKHAKVVFSDEELYKEIQGLSKEDTVELEDILSYEGYVMTFDYKHGCYIID